MSKLLEEGKKPEGTEPAQEQAATPAATPVFGGTFGAYGTSADYRVALKQEWEKSKEGLAWKDSPQGRLAIRTFSRGVMGAAFYTAGGLLTSRWLHNPASPYDPTKSFSEQVSASKGGNPFKFVAKLIDEFVGKPISATVTALGGDGVKAVHFRPTQYTTNGVPGRSLGKEAGAVTWDFFLASVGDAFGRDIAGWVDPNVKKDWLDDKGHVKLPEAVKSAVSSVTRYVTYNGGEDWAVAIPYVYYIKGQRALINHFSPGFKYDSDRNLNGGSFKVGDDHKVNGSFTPEGMLDIHNRFVAYNIGTLMYRELYQYASDIVQGKPVRLYDAPGSNDADKGVGSRVADVGKWMARSAIKGAIYMTPAVPFFYLTRSNQSKHRGLFIHPKEGVLSNDNNGSIHSVFANDFATGVIKDRDTPVFYSAYDEKKGHWSVETQAAMKSAVKVANPALDSAFYPYGMGRTPVEKVNDTIGRVNYKFSKQLDKTANWVGAQPWGKQVNDYFRIPNFSRFTRSFLNASVSYTPYMYAKAETANMWDDGRTDYVLKQTIDGATSGNWSQFKQGIGNLWNVIQLKPLADPAQEAEGQRWIAFDNTPADAFSQTKQAQRDDEKRAILSWRDRLVSKQTPVAQPLLEKAGGDGASLVDTYGLAKRQGYASGERKPVSHAEQEAMREVLAQATPPTNSVH